MYAPPHKYDPSYKYKPALLSSQSSIDDTDLE